MIEVPNDQISIRSLQPGDVEQVVELADSQNLSPWSKDDLLTELSRTDSLLLVAETGGNIFGFIVGRLVPGQRSDQFDAELYNIGVKIEMQNLSIGGRLLQSFLDFCRRNDAGQVWLEVRAGNSKAIAFYQKAGFEEQGIRPNLYRSPTEDAIVMALTLT